MSAATSSSSSSKPTAAGIVERADTQQRVIPESRRADGSVRKERKVRPGFTPVEDVMRYRPARVREAEEARKKGIPGSLPTRATAAAAAAAAAEAPKADSSESPRPSSSPSAPPRLANSEIQRTSWRSNAPQRQAALSFDPKSSPRTERLATNGANKSEASSSGEKSWRNSRLRKPAALDASKAATPAGSSQDVRVETVDSATAKANRSATSDARSSADELAQELDSLRIGKSDQHSQT